MILFSSISTNYVVSFDNCSESLIFEGPLDAAAALQEKGMGEHWISDKQQNYNLVIELQRSEEQELSLYDKFMSIHCYLTIKSNFKSEGKGYAQLSSAQFDKVLTLLNGKNFSMSFTAEIDDLKFKQNDDNNFNCQLFLKTSEISFKSVN